jgi:nicotinate phosphoribosyltransferase
VGGNREIVEFGTRRAHSPDAGVLGARAAYIGGCAGSSNTLAGFRFGIPVVGTAAHAWVMSFASEMDSFRKMQELLGKQSVHLVDTYDTIAGVRYAIEVGQPFWGIRLDSGDFLQLSKQARAMLDEAGFQAAKIMVSGDMDEYKIAALVRNGAPIDAFGVGTELATSGDAPSMGAIYKMVEIESNDIKRYTAKRSLGKHSLPGTKQIFRFPGHDVIARSSECLEGARALQIPVILGGKLIQPLPDLKQSRERAAAALAELPAAIRQIETTKPYPVEYSAQLLQLDQSL